MPENNRPIPAIDSLHAVDGEKAAPGKPILPVWVSYALICTICLAIWGHTVRFGFVWDDQFFIQDHETIRSLKNIPQMFTRLQAQSSLPEGFVLFRPLRTLHYALLYAAGGESKPQPWLFHLANILWHAAAACLVFSVTRLLLQKLSRGEPRRMEAIALFTALGFAVHPVVSEVVCWAKSLDDIMATVFALAATRALLLCDRDDRQVTWATIFFLLAVYSKESAVPLVLMAAALLRAVHQFPWRDVLKRTVPLAAVAAVFVIHRHFVIGRTSQTAPISGSYFQTLIDTLPVATKYLRLSCGLPPFCIDYTYMTGQHGLLSAPVLGGLAVLLAASVIALIAWRIPNLRLFGLGLIWVGVFLLPVSNLLPMMQYMAERFLYLPLIGWLLALACLMTHLRQRAGQWATASALLLVWGTLCWQRSLIWENELELFVRSALEGPKNPRMEENAVAAIFHLPELRVLFRYDKSARSLVVSGPASRETAEKAEKKLTEAAHWFPNDDNLAAALGITDSILGRRTEAIAAFEVAIKLKPTNTIYWVNLALATLEAGETNRAVASIKQALQINPHHVNALRSASRVYWQAGEFAAASEVLKELRAQEPNNGEHAYWLEQAEQKLAEASASK